MNSDKYEDPKCNRCEHKQKVPLLYLYVFRYMVDKFGKTDQTVSAKQLMEIWKRQIYNVPQKYDFHILTEMQEYGLIKRINTQKYIFYGNKSFKKLKILNRFFLW